MESATIAATGGHDEHHGPPTANQSSRVEAQFLGMLLFIISEVMLFGAFFTAYFFLRVVNHDPWPAHGTELPKLIAGINTCILVSSSFTMHWALEGIKNNNRRAMRAGLLTTFLLGFTFLSVQINEYFHLGWGIKDDTFAAMDQLRALGEQLLAIRGDLLSGKQAGQREGQTKLLGPSEEVATGYSCGDRRFRSHQFSQSRCAPP